MEVDAFFASLAAAVLRSQGEYTLARLAVRLRADGERSGGAAEIVSHVPAAAARTLCHNIFSLAREVCVGGAGGPCSVRATMEPGVRGVR